jgi:hypothetical protein
VPHGCVCDRELDGPVTVRPRWPGFHVPSGNFSAKNAATSRQFEVLLAYYVEYPSGPEAARRFGHALGTEVPASDSRRY